LPHQRLETFVKMSADRNAPPKTGWANMVTELHVADLNVSLAFWKDIIGLKLRTAAKRRSSFIWNIVRANKLCSANVMADLRQDP